MQGEQTTREMLEQVENLLAKYREHEDRNTERFVRELESRREVLKRRVLAEDERLPRPAASQ